LEDSEFGPEGKVAGVARNMIILRMDQYVWWLRVASVQTHEGYVSWRIIEVDGGEDDMCDVDIRLGYDGKDGAGPAMFIMLCLIIYYDARRRRGGYRRHLELLRMRDEAEAKSGRLKFWRDGHCSAVNSLRRR